MTLMAIGQWRASLHRNLLLKVTADGKKYSIQYLDISPSLAYNI